MIRILRKPHIRARCVFSVVFNLSSSIFHGEGLPNLSGLHICNLTEELEAAVRTIRVDDRPRPFNGFLRRGGRTHKRALRAAGSAGRRRERARAIRQTPTQNMRRPGREEEEASAEKIRGHRNHSQTLHITPVLFWPMMK